MAVGPVNRYAADALGVPSMASFTSRFFTTLSEAAGLAKPGAQHRHIRNGQTGIMANDHHSGPGEHAFQRFHRFGLLSTIHCGLLSQLGAPANPARPWRTRTSRPAEKTPGSARGPRAHCPRGRPAGTGLTPTPKNVSFCLLRALKAEALELSTI